MPQMTTWTGFLKLSLVTCPVALVPALTAQGRLSFRTLNAKTGEPVESRYVDEETGKPVDDDDRARGYEKDDGAFVILTDEDLDSVALESTRTIDIETFVDEGSIGWIWYDRPHYLIPSEPVGEEAFAVIRQAMEETGRVGIARLVLHGRERAVMLKPSGKGMILWTLRYGDEVRPPVVEEDMPAKSDAEAVRMMTRLIRERTGKWDPSELDDPVQDSLREIIEARTKERPKRRTKAKAETGDEAPSNVIDIMDALKRSLASSAGSGGKGETSKSGKTGRKRRS